MSKILKTASAAAIIFTTAAAFIGTDVSFAFDNAKEQLFQAQPEAGELVSETVIDLQDETVIPAEDIDNGQALTVQPLPENYIEYDAEAAAAKNMEINADSLHDMVSAYAQPDSLSDEMQCLAGAVYFESKGETLKGQLAVARVVIARSESGRFPDSYCGVVYQRSQFSFVRGGKMPRIRTTSKAWSDAVKIARIAHDSAWESPVEGALFFHARYVSPKWRLTKMAAVDNHVFYR